MSHTAGPWAVSKINGLIFGRPHDPGMEPLGFVYGPALPETSEHGRECLDNAKLCAAAPAMLEALEALVYTLEDEVLMHDDQRAAMTQARAVIRAAKGEA